MIVVAKECQPPPLLLGWDRGLVDMLSRLIALAPKPRVADPALAVIGGYLRAAGL